MTVQNSVPSGDNLVTVLNRCKALEAALTEKFGAVGRGLHEKTDSCSQVLPESVVKRLRFIASVRNKTMHEVGFEPPIRDYVQACDAADKELADLQMPSSSAAKSSLDMPTAAAPAPASPTRRLPRLITYPLTLGAIFWLASSLLGEHEEVAKPAPSRAASLEIIPFAAPNSIPEKKVQQQGRAPLGGDYVALWSANSPVARLARFDWRTKQAAFDASHANPVAALPTETLWVLDTSEAGLNSMKEVRKPDGRVLQVDVLLGGKSGLRATLELPMTKPPRGNSEWVAYRYVGVLKFGLGQEVPIAGVQFLGLNGGGAPTPFQVREVFDCHAHNDDGCLGWSLNPRVNAVALSKRGIEYAILTE